MQRTICAAEFLSWLKVKFSLTPRKYGMLYRVLEVGAWQECSVSSFLKS